MSKPKRRRKIVKTKTKTKEVLVPKIQKVVIPPSTILHVKVPSGAVPVVSVLPTKGVVEIIPVPKKKLTWWESIFGRDG